MEGSERDVVHFQSIGHPSDAISVWLIAMSNNNDFVASFHECLRQRILMDFYAPDSREEEV